MRRITKVVSLLWILNFAVYVLIASWLGGDALNGHVEAGHYYVAMHGHSTEVSREVFEFSRWHTFFLIAHFCVAVVLGLVYRRESKSLSTVA